MVSRGGMGLNGREAVMRLPQLFGYLAIFAVRFGCSV